MATASIQPLAGESPHAVGAALEKKRQKKKKKKKRSRYRLDVIYLMVIRKLLKEEILDFPMLVFSYTDLLIVSPSCLSKLSFDHSIQRPHTKSDSI